MDGMLGLSVAGAALVVFVLLGFCIAPGRRRAIPLAAEYAHRGLHNEHIPENSMAAFRAAAEAGLGVELDVQLSADGRLVVFHDATLERMCGDGRRLCELSFDELRMMRLAASGQRIPLFSDVLEAMDGLPVLCEIKTHSGNMKTDACPIVAAFCDGYKGDLVIESFSPMVVRWFRKNRPDIARGQLARNFLRHRDRIDPLSAFAVSNLLTNCLARPDFIAYDYKDDSPGFWLCRTLWKPYLAAWTVRGKGARERIRFLADAIIFEQDETETTGLR